MADPFVHLHVASGYSLRYGASLPPVLVQRAAEHGMDTLALTDRDGVYGAVRFVQACQAYGVRPVLGVNLAVEPAAEPRGEPGARTPVRGGAYLEVSPLPRVTVLATGGRGWAAVCRLVSAAHRRGARGHPVITLDLVAEQITASGGSLVILLGPESQLGRHLAARRADLARAHLRSWLALAQPAALVVEVVHHRGPGEVARAARMASFAADVGLPAVLTNAVRYADRSDAVVADVLDAARQLVPLDARHVDRRTGEGYLKTGKEMALVAEEIARAGGLADDGRGLLVRTRVLAERCVLDPRADLGIGAVHFPELEITAAGATAAGATAAGATATASGVGAAALASGRTPADAVLRARCEVGLHRRFPLSGVGRKGRVGEELAHRLEEELGVIAELGYASYFLTVADVVELIRGMGVRCAARGSGAGSLVTYLTGVSDVDPLRYGLLMERFLSPLRRQLPDVDIDLESHRRTEVYEQVFARYGTERCACVAMMDTYRARHAIRDVGAALGLPPGEIDVTAKAFPHIRAAQIRPALQDLPELRSSELAGPRLDLLFRLAERLDGLPRHIAMHPCGVILSDRTLLDRTPVEPSFAGFAMSQFDKDDVAALGLLKLDLLGVRMQSAISHAVHEVARVDGVHVDVDTVPRDDPATFALIQSTRTLGCFQIESPGQRELIGKFAPERFDDLIIDISLFRPGPVKSDMVRPFLEARQGWATPDYLHPDLVPILAETEGVVVFHEQVLRIVSTLTGASLAEADEVRRALGDPQSQPEVRTWFLPAALRRGYPLPVTEAIWEILRAFASFGFCKAHAAAFAVPTYQSAWLKAHHPAAFLAGVLTHDPGMYPKRLILDDARHFGIAVLPLDINASEAVYRVERIGARAYGIRLSLADVKGISMAETERILAGRPFRSLADFWYRAAPTRPVAERLVLSGALDSVYGLGGSAPARRRGRVTRRDLLLQVAELARPARATVRTTGAIPGIQLAFDLGDDPADSPPSGLPEMNDAERVRAELDVLGVDASRHVMEFYRPFLQAAGMTCARDLLRCRSAQRILVAGVKVATQTPPVRSGRRVVFVTLDDGTGPVDATLFDDAQASCAATVFHSWLLVIRGEVRRTGPRGVSIRALGCWELPTLYRAWRQDGLVGMQAALQGVGQGRSTGPPVPVSQPRVYSTGFRISPYADIAPTGADVRGAPRRLWHASPGSAGG
ncbi:MAG: DNA polymerase III subunit alpha [Mycobacteriales bacterium]